MIEAGRWSLRGGDKIVITHYDDILEETVSAKSHRKTITITRFEPHCDRTFMHVRYPDGGLQRACHNTPAWLISVSLGLNFQRSSIN